MSAPEPVLRRDAERNRALVLSAARQLMGERGIDIPYEEIARAAGVGMGTVYRRFPARQDLLDALFVEHVDAVVALASRAADSEDAWQALQSFMYSNLEMQVRDRALSQLLRGSSHNSELIAEAQTRVGPIVEELVRRAQAAGQLTSEITAGDFVLIELMVGGVIDASRTFDPDLWRRALAMALAGLGEPDRLPGTGPDPRTIEALHGGYDASVSSRHRGR